MAENPKIVICTVCEKKMKMDKMKEHIEKTGHTDFERSKQE